MIKVLELFAGIGAASKSLSKMGVEYEIVDAVEIDKYAIKSFNAIHGTNFEPQDITKWDKDIEADLIVGGFPCQDISLAGKQEGIIKDKTRSGLMYEMMRVIEKVRPKYVIAENVKNILSVKHKPQLDVYISFLEKLGYTVQYKVLDSREYGIPQHRERVFVVGVMGGDDYVFPEPTKKTKDLYDILDFPKRIEVEKPVKIVDDTYKNRPLRIYNNVCPTLRSERNGLKIVIKSGELRKLTEVDYWILMGFDSEDCVKAKEAGVPATQLFRQAGNSIVVDVIGAIIRKLING